MDSFGLGLVLSFTDNASQGMQNASSTLQQLTGVAQSASGHMSSISSTFALAGQSADILGDSLISAGGKITGVIGNMLGEVSSLGATLENARITLNQFWGSAEEGERMLDWIMDFGARSPFESMDLIGIASSFKAAGIDVSQSVEMANGETQALMASLGDLMALHPEVPMARWKLAFQNALSGDTKMLRNSLDVGKLEDQLGHAFGSGEDAVKSMVELTQKLNVEGMMSKMQGTWAQTLSNMSDIKDKFFKGIIDAPDSAFSKMKEGLMNIANALNNISPEKMDALSQAISGGLSLIVNPLVKASELFAKSIGWITDLTEAHPKVAKFLIAIIGLSGGILVAAGMALKFSGSIFMLVSAMNGLKTLGGISGMLNTIGAGFSSLLLTILPLIALAGILYLVWTKNIGGIKDKITSFAANMKQVFNRIDRIVNSSLDFFNQNLTYLQNRSNNGDWFAGLSISIAKVIILFRALVDLWNDNEMDYELFEKMDVLGLRPLVENILILKARFSEFQEGFIKGLDRVITQINKFKKYFKLDSDISPLFDKVTNFLDNLPLDNIEKLGEILGELAGYATMAYTAFKLGGIAIGLLTSPIGLLILAIAGLKLAWDNDLGGIQKSAKEIFDFIGLKFNEFTDWIENNDWDKTFNDLSATLKKTGNEIKEWFQKTDWEALIKPFKHSFQTAKDLFKDLFTNENGQLNISSSITSIADDVLWLVKNLSEFSDEILTSLSPAIKDLASWMGEAWNTWIKADIEKVEAFAIQVIDIVAKLTPMILGFLDNVGKFTGGVTDFTTGMLQVVNGIIEGDLSKVSEGNVKAAEGIHDALWAMGGYFAKLTGSDQNALSILTPEYWTELGNSFKKDWQDLLEWYENSWQKEFWGNFLMSATNGVNGLKLKLDEFNQWYDEFCNSLLLLWDKFCKNVIAAVSSIGVQFNSAWNGMKDAAITAINGIIQGINSLISKVNEFKLPDWLGGGGINIPSIDPLPQRSNSVTAKSGYSLHDPPVGAATGGYVKNEGLVMLHPNELVVNDTLTTGLQSFIHDYSSLPRNVVPVDFVAKQPISRGEDTPIQRNYFEPQSQPSQVDNSVTFSERSIVVNVQNASEEEAERMANLIMQKIQRKQQQESMRNYNGRQKQAV
jgi:hypothetical protein